MDRIILTGIFVRHVNFRVLLSNVNVLYKHLFPKTETAIQAG